MALLNSMRVTAPQRRQRGPILDVVTQLKAICRGLLLLAFVTGSGGQARAEEKPLPADIAAELAEFQVADGFKIDLFASDPNLAKPIQMNFDTRGRLWIVGSESYPQLEPGADPVDKVFVLEDSDRDGRADRSTVFAEGLRIPTGIDLAPEGAYVGNATQLLLLSDQDGDGEADSRRVVLSAFGTEDTHHLIHTFRFAPWGNLFFAQAVYIHSHVETPFGVRRLNGGGFWEFDPKRHQLEIFVTGMTNSWGIAFDRYGQAFGVDNDQYSVNFFPPGAHLIRTPNESHLFPSLVDGKPKYCGAEFVASTAFPEDWQGNLLTCDFRAHRICRYRISDKGGGFHAEELPELIATPNVAFRPVDLKFGPDGALYICDWFNPIINHGEVDFRDPRRDKTHGRIWRVARKEKSPPPADLRTASVPELIELQSSPDGFTQHQSAREVLARDRKESLSALKAWVAKQSDETFLLRGLWLSEALGAVDEELLRRLLEAKDFRVRSAAVRSVTRHLELPDAVELIRARIADEHPRARMEAVRGLALIDHPESMKWALSALDKGGDPVLEYAVKLNARETADRWIGELESGRIAADPPDRWVMALLAVDSPRSVPMLLKLWREGKVKDEAAVLAAIGRHGSSDQLALMLARAADSATSGPIRAAILDALADAWRRRQVSPAGDTTPTVRELLASLDAGLRDRAITLAGLWGLKELRAPLIEMVRKDVSDETVKLAIDAIRMMGGNESADALEQMTAEPRLSKAALAALVALDAPRAAQVAKRLLAKSPEKSGEVIASFIGSKEGPQALGAVMETIQLPKEAAQNALKELNASGQALPSLAKAIRKSAGLSEQERVFTAEQIHKLAQLAMREGDPHRGKEIYERKVLACTQCHAINSAGGKVGPDLTTIGTSAPADYLVESLLLPSAKVKENFHSIVIATEDGQIITGIPEKDSDAELVVRLADDKTVSVPKASIEESKTGGSLMPVDAVDALASQELLDLVRYLAELGKPGPFGPSGEYVARRWELLGPFAAEEGQKRVEAVLKDAKDLEWRESLTTNDGWVYLRELALTPQRPVFFARTTWNVAAPGKFRLILEPGKKAKYFLNGQPLEVEREGPEEASADVELEAGQQTLSVQVDLKQVPNKMKLRAFPLSPAGRLEAAQR